MSYSIDALTSGCYEGTSCLINKFDVKDETVLKELETTITLTKQPNTSSILYSAHLMFSITRIFTSIYLAIFMIGQANTEMLI